jgi:dTDP-4-amino-4,6-dideoxygalactose transaminase
MTARAVTRVSRSVVGSEELEALARVIERGFLGMGPEVKAFEQEIGAYLETSRHVACVSSGTAAVQLALQACGIGHGDDVLVPTVTYVATFQAVAATGARPIACDVDPSTISLDPVDAARRITSRTKAVVPVHYASAEGSLADVYAFAEDANLRVVEDAAHAFGCRRRDGQRVGTVGDVVCFSFDGIKNITSGEGGAVVTADDEVAERVCDARLLAVRKDTDRRFAGERSWEFDVVDQGWRYHMSDLFAAIGRVQLRRLESEFSVRRRDLARRYAEAFAELPGLRFPPSDYDRVVPHIFPIFVDRGMRDPLRETLASRGFETGIHYKPNHLLSRFRGDSSLPVAERLYAEMLTLPLHPLLTASEQDEIVDLVVSSVRGAR